eukprot:6036966-Alexandrium_andersonii.AAC.1
MLEHLCGRPTSGQSELGVQTPARGGRCPSTPNRPHATLRGSESAKVGNPLPSLPDARGPVRSVVRLASGLAEWKH